jgi:hypothetical protein
MGGGTGTGWLDAELREHTGRGYISRRQMRGYSREEEKGVLWVRCQPQWIPSRKVIMVSSVTFRCSCSISAIANLKIT